MNNSKSIKINLDNTNEIVDIIKNKHSLCFFFFPLHPVVFRGMLEPKVSSIKKYK